jgi:hypothetical protein
MPHEVNSPSSLTDGADLLLYKHTYIHHLKRKNVKLIGIWTAIKQFALIYADGN